MESHTKRTLLNEKELAERLSIPVGTIQNWRSPYRGRGPKPVKLGAEKKSSVRYRLTDVIAWEESLPYLELSTTQQNALAEAERVA